MTHTEDTATHENAVVKVILAFLIVCSSLMGLYACAPEVYEAQKAAETKDEKTSYISVAEGPYATGTHHALIHVKDYGDIRVELNASVAPVSVSNFANLVEKGFYNGLTFHRIINGFMIQGGDPNGDGTGGSDKQILGEFKENGVSNPLPHTRGVISMARSQDNNSASSQFFICHQNSPHLDGKYASFGMVTEGMEVVDKIVASTKSGKDGAVDKKDQPVIESIEMID